MILCRPIPQHICTIELDRVRVQCNWEYGSLAFFGWYAGSFVVCNQWKSNRKCITSSREFGYLAIFSFFPPRIGDLVTEIVNPEAAERPLIIKYWYLQPAWLAAE